MKVIFLTHHLKGTDGWSRYANDLAQDLQKQGADVLCLVHEYTENSPLKQERPLGAPLGYIANPFASFSTAKSVRGMIEKFSPDIVHVIVEPYATVLPFLGNISLNSLGKKSPKWVITVHSTYAFLPILVSGWRRLVSTILTRKLYAKIDSVIAVSEFTKQHLLRHMTAIGEQSLVANKIDVLAGGVHMEHATPNIPAKNNSPKEILFVGALKPRKGLLEAINALAFVKTNVVYRIVGTYKEQDPYIQLLKQKITEHHLEGKIIFEGQVSNEKLQALYANADLFLMLSTNNGADFEGYGLVYIEANAHGVPCIGPKDSGVSDAIRDGKTGFLVDQYNSQTVAQKVDAVLVGNLIKPEDCIAWARENSTDKKAAVMLGLYKKL